MIKVNITKQSNYPVSTPALRKKMREFLQNKGIVSDAEVSLAIVGEAKMLDLGKKYLNDKNVHDVLSFTSEEMGEKFVYPPDGKIHLGEVILCYPKIFDAARSENKLIDQKMEELMLHGATHLLGIHHE